MGVVHDVVVAACGVVGALGVALLVLPARQVWLRGWLRRSGVDHDDSSVLAVQAAASRAAITAAGVLVVLALAFLALGLKAVGLALAVPLAGLVAGFVPVGGGAHRRASLTRATGAGRGRPMMLLAAAGLAVAAGLLWVQGAAFEPDDLVSGLALGASIVLPELAVYAAPVLAGVAVVVPVVVVVAQRVIAGRPGLSGASGPVDLLLRRHQARVAVHAGVAAELVLAAVLVRFAPLLVSGPGPAGVGVDRLVQVAGVLCLVLVVAALAVFVRGASVTVARRRRVPAPATVR